MVTEMTVTITTLMVDPSTSMDPSVAVYVDPSMATDSGRVVVDADKPIPLGIGSSTSCMDAAYVGAGQ